MFLLQNVDLCGRFQSLPLNHSGYKKDATSSRPSENKELNWEKERRTFYC